MKYLMIPNVVILLGAKLNQLKIGIASSYTKYHKEDLLLRYEINEMAIKYLDKFIPMPNRVFMPDPENIINTPLKVILKDGLSMDFPSVAFAVTSLIYHKTRYLFYNHDGVPSMIIPRNLREIRMLVTSLINRKDPVAEDNDIHNDNKTFFKNYFISQWIPTLESKYQEFAKDLMEETDISKINKEAIKYLMSVSEDFIKWIDITEDSEYDLSSSSLLRRRLRDISNPANTNVNITVGDVMAMASTIGEIENSHKMARLVFFIQTFYSMKLYELYDEMTSPENLDENGIIVKEETPRTIPVLKNSKNTVMPEYLTLAAGDFFVLTGDSFIPFSKTRASREIRLIDGDVLNENIRDIINELYDKEKKEWKPASEMQIARLKVIEFFVLCTRRALAVKKADYSLTKSENWRQNLDPSYITYLGSTQNIIFEVTAPFFNLVYPEFAYRRFHPDLYELALKCDGSLLRLILEKEKRDEGRNDFADLMSRISIRNIEVLADLNKWLIAKKDHLRAAQGDARSILIQFFTQFSNKYSHYSVKTYDRQADKPDFHVIEFKPMAMLAKAIDIDSSDIENQLPLISLFEKIYNPMDELQAGITYTQDEVRQRIIEINAPDSLEVNKWVDDIYKHTVTGNLTPQFLINGLIAWPLISDDLLQSLFSPELRKKYKDTYIQNKKAHIDDLEISIKLTNAELGSLKRRISPITNAQENATAHLEKETFNFKKLSDKKWEKSYEASEILRKMNDCKNEISNLSEEREEIAKKLSEPIKRVHDPKTNLIVEITNDSKDWEKELHEIDSKAEKLRSELSQLESKFDKNNSEIIAIDNESAVLASSLNKARNELNNLTSQLNTLSEQISERENRKQYLTIQKKKLNEEYKELEKKLKTYRP